MDNFNLESSLTYFKRTQWWKNVPLGPPDIILGIFEDFKVDQNPNKIDLSVGAYRDEHGKPYVLKSVLKAEQNLVDKNQNKESDGKVGSEYFREVTFRLAVSEKLFDRSHVSVQVRIFFFVFVICVYVIFIYFRAFYLLSQSISGSGSIKVAAETIGKIYKGNKLIFISDPSWAYHAPIFSQSGVETAFYRYFDPKSHEIDHAGMMTDLMVSFFWKFQRKFE